MTYEEIKEVLQSLSRDHEQYNVELKESFCRAITNDDVRKKVMEEGLPNKIICSGDIYLVAYDIFRPINIRVYLSKYLEKGQMIFSWDLPLNEAPLECSFTVDGGSI